jgi:hypothetical protein
MSKIILISNPVDYHYEILEDIIQQATKIVDDKKCILFDIYLSVYDEPVFKKYISENYPHVHLSVPKNYDYIIHASVYMKHENPVLSKIKIIPNSKKEFFIVHETHPNFKRYNNVYSFTPFLKKQNQLRIYNLPFSDFEKIKTNIPIFAVQGNLEKKKIQRRDWTQLIEIFESQKKNNLSFLVKLIGRGNLPEELKPYQDKIILRNNLNFIDFHYEFLDVYCLLALNSPEHTPSYFKNKFTSNITYLQTYKMKGIMHKNLYKLYPHLQNIHTFSNNQQMVKIFEKVIDDFYR